MDRTTVRGWALAAASLTVMVASVWYFVVLDGGGRRRVLHAPLSVAEDVVAGLLPEPPDVPMVGTFRFFVRWKSGHVYWAYFTGDPENELLEEPWGWGADEYYADPERIVCANQWVAAASRRLALR